MGYCARCMHLPKTWQLLEQATQRSHVSGAGAGTVQGLEGVGLRVPSLDLNAFRSYSQASSTLACRCAA